MDNLKDKLSFKPVDDSIVNTQKAIILGREKTLSKVAHSPARQTIDSTTTNTVIPGKVIKRTVTTTTNQPKSSGSSSNSTTKTS